MTMLMRFDPFRDIDRVFDRAWGTAGQSIVPMDAYRHGDSFVVQLDLPGVDPASLDIGVEQHVLTISAERHWEAVDGDEVIANERRQGKFTRQLFLGDALDVDAIHASYDNGVLTLTIPVSEKAKPRKIEISQSSEPTSISTTSS